MYGTYIYMRTFCPQYSHVGQLGGPPLPALLLAAAPLGFGARWEPAGDAGRRERGDAGRWERGDGERLLGGINKCIGREGHGEFSLR